MNTIAKKSMMVVLFSLFTLISMPVWAEMIHGTVEMVDPQDNSLKLRRLDQIDANKSIDVRVDKNANMGKYSLSDLQVGDEVFIEADRNFLGRWNASGVAKTREDLNSIATVRQANEFNESIVEPTKEAVRNTTPISNPQNDTAQFGSDRAPDNTAQTTY